MATNPPTDPDPRTGPDDNEDAANEGVSTPTPAEGDDTGAPEQPGSPRG